MTRKEELARASKDYHLKQHPNFTFGEYVAFIDGAQWADQHPHWISVEDELPKDSCYILVTSRGIVHHWRYDVLESADVLKNMYGITHWMPMPQAPILSNSEKGGEG